MQAVAGPALIMPAAALQAQELRTSPAAPTTKTSTGPSDPQPPYNEKSQRSEQSQAQAQTQTQAQPQSSTGPHPQFPPSSPSDAAASDEIDVEKAALSSGHDPNASHHEGEEEGEGEGEEAAQYRDVLEKVFSSGGDPDLVTWDGPEDPANPKNFSKGRKWTMLLVVSMCECPHVSTRRSALFTTSAWKLVRAHQLTRSLLGIPSMLPSATKQTHSFPRSLPLSWRQV